MINAILNLSLEAFIISSVTLALSGTIFITVWMGTFVYDLFKGLWTSF